MEILYKQKDDKSDFRLIENNCVLNLNNTLIKITSDNLIKEVEIDDEIVKLSKQSNQFVYHKLKTTNKSIIKINVKEIDKNNKEKKTNRLIKVNPKEYVYNRYEIEKINYLGERSFENITNNFQHNNDDNSENTINTFGEELDNLDDIFDALNIIIKMANKIIKTPKVDLLEKDVIKDSNEVKKISSHSARFFTMHPEYWYKEGESLPKPTKLLTETFEENKNIYENQLIKHIIYNSKNMSKNIIYNLQSSISILNANILKDQTYLDIQDVDEYERTKRESDIQVNTSKYKKNQQSLKKIKSIYRDLEELESNFYEVKLYKKIKFRMTQKILYDKRYLQIIKLYNSTIKNLIYNSEEFIDVKKSVDYNYRFIISELICTSLYSLGFYEIESEVDKDYGKVFVENDLLIIKGIHIYKELEFNLELPGLTTNLGAIDLKISYKDKVEKIRFKVNYISNNEKIDLEDIEKIYKVNNSDKHNTTIVLNTIGLDEIDFISDEVKRKGIFKLSTLGDNFVSNEDYKKYGKYKQGMISYTAKDTVGIVDMLVKLFRMKFIKLGFYEYCTYCKSGSYILKEKELMVCSHCSKTIAVNKCNHCGEDIIKFLSKEVPETTYDLLEMDSVEYHKMYQIKSANLGSCYESFYSNSGGYCSNCGNCQRKTRNCIRCNIMSEEGNEIC